MSIENLPANKSDRITGCKYLYNDEIRIWTGKILHCEHNRKRSICKQCGGSSICEHSRQKNVCRECEGISICEHNKRRNRCKNCRGASICEHNRERSNCKQCGGTNICEHNRQRSFCKECKGGGICEHNKIRSYCKECKGGSICEHNRIRRLCKECKGLGICVHNRERTICKECRGTGICEHNKRRTCCKECKGSSICEHNKIKSICKECSGGSICEHYIERRCCRDCFTHPKNFCQSCTYVYVRGLSYYPYCFRCYCYLHPDENIPRRYRMKENYINDFLKEYYPHIVNNKTIASSCSSRKRPDWYIELLTHTIIIECDENQHNNYSCENKRMMQLFTDLGDRPIVFIRFNPDKYKEKNISSDSGDCFYYDDKNKLQVNETEWRERSKILLQTIKDNEKIPDKEITIIKLFFTENE